jgi:hypothetical protein
MHAARKQAAVRPLAANTSWRCLLGHSKVALVAKALSLSQRAMSPPDGGTMFVDIFTG